MTFYCTPPIQPPACLFMASNAILDGQQISWNPSCLWTPRCILGAFRRFAKWPSTATWTRPGGGIAPVSLALRLGPEAFCPIAPLDLTPGLAHSIHRSRARPRPKPQNTWPGKWGG